MIASTATTKPHDVARPRPVAASRSLMLHQVRQLPAEQAFELFRRDFLASVTIVIAEALGRATPQIQQFLRDSEQRLDWIDALMWAEGELSIAAERAQFDCDPKYLELVGQLRAVRKRIHEARTLARRERQTRWLHSPEYRAITDAEFTARKWLCEAFPADFKSVLREVMSQRGIQHQHDGSARDIFDAVRQGHAERWLDDPVTDDVRELLALSDKAFRHRVVKDTSEHARREDALSHPLLLHRWDAALRELAAQTYSEARATDPMNLGPTPEILLKGSSGISRRSVREAHRVLRKRRFLAAIHQRHIECTHYAQQAFAEIEEAKQHDPGRQAYRAAKNRARHLLAEQHAAEFSVIRDALRRYESSPGVLDINRLPDDHRRGYLKRELVTAAREAGKHQASPSNTRK